MKRMPIDQAQLAQMARREALLRDIARSGGTDRWDHLRSHGHHHATIARAMRQGYVMSPKRHQYILTYDGRCEAHRSIVERSPDR